MRNQVGVNIHCASPRGNSRGWNPNGEKYKIYGIYTEFLKFGGNDNSLWTLRSRNTSFFYSLAHAVLIVFS